MVKMSDWRKYGWGEGGKVLTEEMKRKLDEGDE